MATRTRGNIPARRPQTGTIQHPRPRPISSKITSFAQNQDSKSSQNQDSKSTKTPTTNVSKQQSKRPTPGDTAHKPAFIRRSTFDDPSSPSTTQNTRVSPYPTLRPSTFSSKAATMQKTVPARKPSSPYTRPVNNVKKRFIYVKKQDIRACAATTKEQFGSLPEKVEVSNSYDVTQPEQNPKVQESSINEAEEEAIQVGSSNENKADVLVQVDPDPISNTHTKAENDKDVDLTNDKQDITLAVKTEVTEDISQVPETVNIVNNINQEFSDADNINEINSSKTHENATDNPTSGVEETNKEPAKTVVSDKKEAVGTESEVPETKETEAQEVGRQTENVAAKTLVPKAKKESVVSNDVIEAQEVGRQTENVAAKTQVPKAKKESVVSNDVIKETASKLREQRKNKVKALAGAFETVISLQEQK